VYSLYPDQRLDKLFSGLARHAAVATITQATLIVGANALAYLLR
jgi:hypothetical protein